METKINLLEESKKLPLPRLVDDFRYYFAFTPKFNVVCFVKPNFTNLDFWFKDFRSARFFFKDFKNHHTEKFWLKRINPFMRYTNVCSYVDCEIYNQLYPFDYNINL